MQTADPPRSVRRDLVQVKGIYVIVLWVLISLGGV